MASIDSIKASDGTGNAAVATVQNSRAALSSTIVVDTVSNINDNFMGSMGTPHTFVDPVTSETITVISEATCVDFSGHVDGSNLEIDDIAPGQTDLGSDVDDIVIIRPTTQWGDNVAAVLEAAHDDDGTLKAGAVDAAAVLASNVVTTAKILNGNVTPAKWTNPYSFRAYQSADQNMSDNTATKVNLATESYDYNSNFVTGTYTAPVAGVYNFAGVVNHLTASVATIGKTYTMIYVNGAEVLRGPIRTASAAEATGSMVAGDLLLAAGNTVELWHYQDSNGTEVAAAGTNLTYFSGHLVHQVL